MMLNRCDLNKPGVKQLNRQGTYAVIANRKLYDSGKSNKFVVVNTSERWVESIHHNFQEAVSYTRTHLI